MVKLFGSNPIQETLPLHSFLISYVILLMTFSQTILLITMGCAYGKHNEEYACKAFGREQEHNERTTPVSSYSLIIRLSPGFIERLAELWRIVAELSGRIPSESLHNSITIHENPAIANRNPAKNSFICATIVLIDGKGGPEKLLCLD